MMDEISSSSTTQCCTNSNPGFQTEETEDTTSPALQRVRSEVQLRRRARHIASVNGEREEQEYLRNQIHRRERYGGGSGEMPQRNSVRTRETPGETGRSPSLQESTPEPSGSIMSSIPRRPTVEDYNSDEEYLTEEVAVASQRIGPDSTPNLFGRVPSLSNQSSEQDTPVMTPQNSARSAERHDTSNENPPTIYDEQIISETGGPVRHLNLLGHIPSVTSQSSREDTPIRTPQYIFVSATVNNISNGNPPTTYGERSTGETSRPLRDFHNRSLMEEYLAQSEEQRNVTHRTFTMMQQSEDRIITMLDERSPGWSQRNWEHLRRLPPLMDFEPPIRQWEPLYPSEIWSSQM
ncbi:uncharacterized protein RSE6_13748 [Rhynchosporium secalis]|uniref:Uncharacterized protein n=1 Tax=Rhynchosporium secalis TaxID=38038 RepID=A0A1E1MTL0_RHYSE|nr:uncharacterized protein RSE6_13748 [Rhynchosporium secalis]